MSLSAKSLMITALLPLLLSAAPICRTPLVMTLSWVRRCAHPVRVVRVRRTSTSATMAIIDRAKLQHVEQFSSNSTSSSIIVYRTIQPEYRYAEYLSSVRCFSNRRLLSRFRCGCHGLHVDTGRWVDTKRKDRLCQVCHSSRDVEDEQHFLFSCPAYSDVEQKHASLFQQALLSQTFSLTLNQMHVVVFSESVFHLENLLYPPDISMNAYLCVVFCLLAPCWSPGH